MAEVTITKNGVEVCSERKDLVEASQTHDGIVFNFKYGVHFYCSDPHMPLATKQLIQASIANFKKGKVKIDLTNYNNPASVEL